MKLYAITTSERESRPAKKGGDKWLQIEINSGNNQVIELLVREAPNGVVCSYSYDDDAVIFEPVE